MHGFITHVTFMFSTCRSRYFLGIYTYGEKFSTNIYENYTMLVTIHKLSGGFTELWYP